VAGVAGDVTGSAIGSGAFVLGDKRMRIAKLCCVIILTLPGAALAQVPDALPDYYPESYAEIVEAGARKGPW
jgi:hypothetical protein